MSQQARRPAAVPLAHLARYSSHGYVELLGRADDQIKNRGFRIEHGEVEVVLRQHADIDDAVVTVDRTAGGRDDARLVAYVVTRPGAALNVSTLDAFLRGRLPWFMIPANYQRLDALPVSASGKVDKRALPPFNAGAAAGRHRVPAVGRCAGGADRRGVAGGHAARPGRRGR